ncbi:TonB-dependent receptor [Limisphaera sp. VF-2]|uniref:TonB-dependent receptor n=1 Tax=Limisphaera sp. VF-2 TaxID=3400418 RepID=UPI003C1C0FE6
MKAKILRRHRFPTRPSRTKGVTPNTSTPSRLRPRWVRPGLCLGLLLALTRPPATAQPLPPAQTLPPVVVTGRADDLVGIADAASVGYIGSAQLDSRPKLRPAEVLETVPGLIASQHSGAGKANQYYLRGFNLDHGTDFAASLEGMPLNLPTHAHGQGYLDLNPIIPELIDYLEFRKGPYYADLGDFSSAGAADLYYVRHLPSALLRLEAGSFNYARGLWAESLRFDSGDWLYAIEGHYNDGPWTHPEHFVKGNALLRWSTERDGTRFSLLATAYRGEWDATDQIPRRAVGPTFSQWNTLDPTSGGDSHRFNLMAQWAQHRPQSHTRALAYAAHYDLDLFSNFTYFLDNPDRGDQFEQADRRWILGTKTEHARLWDATELAFGLDLRADFIRNGLHRTQNRLRWETIRADRVTQVALGPYLYHRQQWSEWLRSYAGLRLDAGFYEVDSNLPVNSGSESDALWSPKLGLVFGPWKRTEFYLNAGLGFHSNDGRGATTRLDPASGEPVSPVDPLVPTRGAEIGLRTTWIDGLHSTLSLWILDIDSELLFLGDAGTTEASRPSRRFGVEWANFFTLRPWLVCDLDVAWSHARFRDDDPAGDHIPGAPEWVIAAGLTVPEAGRFSGSLRLRYFGPRPLIEDNSVRSEATALVSAEIGYRFLPRWSVALQAFNLLDRRDNDIDYYYISRLPGEPLEGVADVHSHPAEPFALRLVLTGRF